MEKTYFDDLNNEEKKSIVETIIDNLVLNFVYYDRKNCELMSTADIENMLRDEILTLDEILLMFKESLEHNLL